MNRGRELGLAVGACTLAGVLVLLAAGRCWARVVVDVADVPVTVHLVGAELAPVLRALGLVALAGAVAVVATRRTGRRLAGVVLALAGTAVVVSAVMVAATLSNSALTAAARTLGREQLSAGEVGGSLWPYVASTGGLILLGAGVFTCLRGPSWPTLGARYEAAGTPRRPAPRRTGEAGMWDAIDRGEDPT